MSSARWLSSTSDHCCVRPIVPGLLPLTLVFKLPLVHFILYSYCIVCCVYLSIALLVFFLCSYFIECRSCFIPMTSYASPDAFLPNTYPAQIIPKTSLRHAARRFVYCELRKRARNTRLDSGCCHRSLDNRMGSRLVGEYVSQTANVQCSVLKVCSIIWRCFVFLDITAEMFLVTDLVLSLH